MANKENVIIYISERSRQKEKKVQTMLEKHCEEKNYEIVDYYFERKKARDYKEISNPIYRKFCRNYEQLLFASNDKRANIILISELSKLGNFTFEILNNIYFVSKNDKIIEVAKKKLGNKIKFYDFIKSVLDFIAPIIFNKKRILYRKGKVVSIPEIDCLDKGGKI